MRVDRELRNEEIEKSRVESLEIEKLRLKELELGWSNGASQKEKR